MQRKNKVVGNIFLATVVLGAVLVAAEIVFQFFDRSLCPTEGCRLVSNHTRFGDISILLIGLVTFSALAMMSYPALYKNRTRFERPINIVLVVSLAAEGFFTGYQAFSIHMACVFCLIMFAFFMALGILRFLYGEKEVVAGFLSFAGVFALFYLILPTGSTVSLPEEELTLFYSKDCKYCAEVMKEIEAGKMKVIHLDVREYAGYLKNIGIEHVPTLFVNKKNRKFFLTGKEEIVKYLFPDPKDEKGKEKNAKTSIQKTKNKTSARVDKSENAPGLLPEQLNSPANLFVLPADDGMCKETLQDEKCK
jgi:uncharacterized membrane protein/glutaredoxin